ncbi:MAG: hypothetical protein WA784_07480 [Albidovulum sp.]
MHGTFLPPRPIARDPRAERIAALSHEYLSATPERREEIGAEVAALVDGGVAVFPSAKPR